MQFGHTLTIKGKPVKLYAESGIVMGKGVKTTTYVSGDSNNVTSTTSTETSFSLIGADGVERPHQFTDADFFIRNGNRVSLVMVETRKRKTWNIGYNHDTGKGHYVCTGADLVCNLGLIFRVSYAVALLGLIASFASGFVLLPVFIGFWGLQGLRARIIWWRHLKKPILKIYDDLGKSDTEIRWPRLAA